MFSSLSGKVEEIASDTITLDVHGAGYEVICSRRLLDRLSEGSEVKIPVHTDVQETSIRIFGFEDRGERQVFRLLNKVNGLGPRSAIDIVSQVDKRDLLRAIGAGDVNALMRVKGIGKKKAERIVVELKDLVVAFSMERPGLSSEVSKEIAPSPLSSGISDAVAALEALGFTRRDAERAVEQAAAAQGSTAVESGVLVREALRFV